MPFLLAATHAVNLWIFLTISISTTSSDQICAVVKKNIASLSDDHDDKKSTVKSYLRTKKLTNSLACYMYEVQVMYITGILHSLLRKGRTLDTFIYTEAATTFCTRDKCRPAGASFTPHKLQTRLVPRITVRFITMLDDPGNPSLYSNRRGHCPKHS